TAAGGVGNQGYEAGQGVGMRFDSPKGLRAVERAGVEVLVVADAGNNVVRFVNISNLASITTTKATDISGFNDPSDIEIDASGNVYVADRQNYCIKKIDLTGTVTVVAGQEGLAGTDNGNATTKAKFVSPTGLFLDGDDIYVADGTSVRKVSNGKVTTVALEPDYSFSYDMGGMANATDLLKMGDTWLVSDGCTIRKYANGSKYFQTFAGSNWSNDCGNKINENDTFARFQNIYQLFYDDNADVIYAADNGNNKIRMIKEGGVNIENTSLNATTLFPNPAKNQVFIQGLKANKGEQLSVSVIDITGKMVYQKQHKVLQDQMAISINDFNSGLYFVTLAKAGQVLTKKLYVK
ncbi:MAG: T9SS type A sorting domain-containing protein, partial [Bacteroidia bacterium]